MKRDLPFEREVSAGRLAYERDREARPGYHDGTLRKEWDEISEIARWSWERYCKDGMA